MIGGPWPDRHIRPRTSTVLVLGSSRTTVKRVTVADGVFAFTVPAGDYEVSARVDQLVCGPAQRVTIPSRDTALHFVCPIK